MYNYSARYRPESWRTRPDNEMRPICAFVVALHLMFLILYVLFNAARGVFQIYSHLPLWSLIKAFFLCSADEAEATTDAVTLPAAATPVCLALFLEAAAMAIGL